MESAIVGFQVPHWDAVLSLAVRAAEITGLGYHILTAAEFLLAAGAGALIAFKEARQPFCERCKRWYDGNEIFHMASGEKTVIPPHRSGPASAKYLGNSSRWWGRTNRGFG